VSNIEEKNHATTNRCVVVIHYCIV